MADAGKSMFVSSSFQTHSLPLLHILSGFVPEVKTYFIQTGFHFPETMHFRTEVGKAFGMEIHDVSSAVPKLQQRDSEGNFYFTSDPDYCCFLNKTQPMEPLLAKYDVWINGIRADQNANRGNMPRFAHTPQGAMRYHPMLDWTKQEIWRYIAMHDLPRHPLDEKGYVSIGCEPCTMKPSLENDREGRWFGQSKTECGLHLDLVKK